MYILFLLFQESIVSDFWFYKADLMSDFASGNPKTGIKRKHCVLS